MRDLEKINEVCYDMFCNESHDFENAYVKIEQPDLTTVKYNVFDKALNKRICSITFGFDDNDSESCFVSNLDSEFDIAGSRYLFDVDLHKTLDFSIYIE